MKKSVFGTYHPIINFSYFCAVIAFGMFLLHPFFLAIALIASFTYAFMLNGRKSLKFSLIFILPLLVIIPLINMLFNHMGETVVAYLWDNPLTMESLIFGITTAFMFASVILWFSCYNTIMTSDKIIYLFGRILPSISMIFCMALRFIPNFREHIKVISRAQRCIGKDISNGSKKARARHGIKILSIMTTWALENGIETADSMRSRGFGLKGRKAFSIFRFDRRDAAAAFVMTGLVSILVSGIVLGFCQIEFFPSLIIRSFGIENMVITASYLTLCFMPILIEVKEEIQWKLSQSRI